MFTLHICFGMFLAICGSVSEYDYPTQGECLKAREQVISQVGDGYAICFPKGLNTKRK